MCTHNQRLGSGTSMFTLESRHFPQIDTNWLGLRGMIRLIGTSKFSGGFNAVTLPLFNEDLLVSLV